MKYSSDDMMPRAFILLILSLLLMRTLCYSSLSYGTKCCIWKTSAVDQYFIPEPEKIAPAFLVCLWTTKCVKYIKQKKKKKLAQRNAFRKSPNTIVLGIRLTIKNTMCNVILHVRANWTTRLGTAQNGNVEPCRVTICKMKGGGQV